SKEKLERLAIAGRVFEQDRTLEREHSTNGFHKQANLVERTWNDDLRAMSYGFGIAIVVLVTEQNVILQTADPGRVPMSALQMSSATSPMPVSQLPNSRRRAEVQRLGRPSSSKFLFTPARKASLCIAATLLLIVPLLMVEADARMGGGGGGGGGRGFGGGGFGGGRGLGGGRVGGGRRFCGVG